MISYKFDLYPRDDPRDGARILRFTQLGDAEWNAEANGTGSGFLVLPADSTDADSIDPRGLQYVRVVEVDDAVADGATLSGFAERVVFGFFLDTGDFSVLDERNTKRLTFGGAGTLSYWGRAVMAPHTYLGAAGELSGISGGQDPFDGAWRLFAQGPLIGGDHLGAVLYRVLGEAKSWQAGAYSHKHGDGIIYVDTHADDRLETAVPDAIIDFDGFLDSNGNAWTEPAGGFRVAILDNVLSVMRLLMEAGLYVEMDPDTFETNAYPAATHRRDRTGATWGAGVVRFQAPTDGTLATGNILSDVKRALTPHIQRSVLWAGGAGDVYAVATGTTDIPWEGGYHSDAEDTDALSAVATRQVGALADAGDTLRIRWVPGKSPATGYFRPLHTDGVLLDDLATVHNGSGTWDFDEQTFPVAGVGAKLRSGGDWDVFYDLGASYRPMESRQFQVRQAGAHTHAPNPQLCRAMGAASDAPAIYGPNTFDSATDMGGDFVWSGTYSEDSGASHGDTGANILALADPIAVGSGDVRIVGTALRDSGVSQRLFGYRWLLADESPHSSGDFDIGSVGAASGAIVAFDVIESPPDGTVAYIQPYVRSPSAYGELAIYQGTGLEGSEGDGHRDLVGTASRATRCDHKHMLLRQVNPTVNDDVSRGIPVTTVWRNTASGDMFVLEDNTEGAAVWESFGGTDDQTAAEVSYSNATSGLTATDVQAAIDEVVATSVDHVHVWNETPTGTVDGSNDEFYLAFQPDPTASLHVFLDGVLQTSGTDFTLVALYGEITFTTPPPIGSVIRASYVGDTASEAPPAASAWDTEIDGDGPFAWWKLSELSGTLAADEEGGHDGTHVNSPTLGVAGEEGNAVTYVAASSQRTDLTTLGTFGSQMDNGFSIELLARWTSTATANMFGVVNASGTGLRVWANRNNTGSNNPGRVSMLVNGDSGSASRASTSQVLEDGAWHHIVFTFAGGTATPNCYIDGVLDNGASTSGTPVTVDFSVAAALAALNSAGTISAYWSGDLDEAVLYTRALTSTEVADHFAALSA